MTEDEAKTKWCPFARVTERWPDGNTGVRNRMVDGPTLEVKAERLAGCQCIGSACMAWRWRGPYPLPDDPPSISNRYEGYCGLAGKP